MNEGLKIKLRYTDPNSPDSSPEYLCAARVTENTARLESMPVLSSQIGRGDLVRHDESKKIVDVLERASRTRWLVYGEDRRVLDERYSKIMNSLEKYGICTEQAYPGLCTIAVPLEIDKKKLEAIAADLSVMIFDPEDKDVELLG